MHLHRLSADRRLPATQPAVCVFSDMMVRVHSGSATCAASTTDHYASCVALRSLALIADFTTSKSIHICWHVVHKLEAAQKHSMMPCRWR